MSKVQQLNTAAKDWKKGDVIFMPLEGFIYLIKSVKIGVTKTAPVEVEIDLINTQHEVYETITTKINKDAPGIKIPLHTPIAEFVGNYLTVNNLEAFTNPQVGMTVISRYNCLLYKVIAVQQEDNETHLDCKVYIPLPGEDKGEEAVAEATLSYSDPLQIALKHTYVPQGLHPMEFLRGLWTDEHAKGAMKALATQMRMVAQPPK